MNKVYVDFADSSLYLRHAAIGSFSNEKLYIPWRMIYDFEIIFMIEGSITVEYKGKKKIELNKYDVHFMEPGVWHKRYSKQGEQIKYYNFHFEFTPKGSNKHSEFDVRKLYINSKAVNDKVDVIETLLDRDILFINDCKLPSKLSIVSPQTMLFCCQKIINEYCKGSKHSKLKADTMFKYFVADIIDEVKNPTQPYTISLVIKEFIDYIIQNIVLDIDVVEFAQEHGFSYDYFRKAFKQAEGISPQQYIQQQKIALAKNYLKSGLYNVDTVSKMVGFLSPYYFSAQFKKVTGRTPKSYIPGKSGGESNEK